MIIEKDFKENVLEYYGEVIDSCLFSEAPFYTEIKDDPISGYLVNTITDHLSLNPQPSLWKQTLRTGLMRFLEEVLEMYYYIIKDYNKQLSLIEQFVNIPLHEKMMMWERVYGSIVAHYTSNELDIEIYNQLLLDADDEGDIEATLDAFINNWQEVNQKQKNNRIRSMIENHSNTPFAKCYGSHDYRINKDIETTYQQYHIQKEIAEVLGRE